MQVGDVLILEFLSTPSARRATVCAAADLQGFVISIHALREEGDEIPETAAKEPEISIHALREEGDLRTPGGGTFGRVISIHALREEGDCQTRSYEDRNGQFLSTPSARRATSRRIRLPL